MGKGKRLKEKKEQKKDDDALLIELSSCSKGIRLPEMTAEEKKDLIGQRIKTPDGREFIMKEVTHRELSDGESISNVEAVQISTSTTMHLGENAEIVCDWTEEKYLDILYELFLDAVQFSDLHLSDKMKGKYEGKIYTEDSTFEEFCTDALDRLKEQRTTLKIKLSGNKINERQHGNATELIERCESTLNRFLEGTIKYE